MWRGGVVVRPLDSVCMGPVTSTGSRPVCLLLQPIGLVQVHLPRAYIQNGHRLKRLQNDHKANDTKTTLTWQMKSLLVIKFL